MIRVGPDGDLAGANGHALDLAGERVAVTAGDYRDVAGEPAVRTDHRDAERLLVGRDLVGGQRAGDVVRHRVRDAVDVKPRATEPTAPDRSAGPASAEPASPGRQLLRRNAPMAAME